jgi:cysteinyl-tRNA synthetase
MRLYNSQSRSKEDFKTIIPNKVLMYVCGITPNNATHIGHAFTYVSFDVLVRYLNYKGFEVNYLQNVTDINDGDDVIVQAKKQVEHGVKKQSIGLIIFMSKWMRLMYFVPLSIFLQPP